MHTIISSLFPFHCYKLFSKATLLHTHTPSSRLSRERTRFRLTNRLLQIYMNYHTFSSYVLYHFVVSTLTRQISPVIQCLQSVRSSIRPVSISPDGQTDSDYTSEATYWNGLQGESTFVGPLVQRKQVLRHEMFMRNSKTRIEVT